MKYERKETRQTTSGIITKKKTDFSGLHFTFFVFCFFAFLSENRNQSEEMS